MKIIDQNTSVNYILHATIIYITMSFLFYL